MLDIERIIHEAMDDPMHTVFVVSVWLVVTPLYIMAVIFAWALLFEFFSKVVF